MTPCKAGLILNGLALGQGWETSSLYEAEKSAGLTPTMLHQLNCPTATYDSAVTWNMALSLPLCCQEHMVLKTF